MIRAGITYRFKQRVTEAGIFPGFFVRKKIPADGRGNELQRMNTVYNDRIMIS